MNKLTNSVCNVLSWIKELKYFDFCVDVFGSNIKILTFNILFLLFNDLVLTFVDFKKPFGLLLSILMWYFSEPKPEDE